MLRHWAWEASSIPFTMFNNSSFLVGKCGLSLGTWESWATERRENIDYWLRMFLSPLIVCFLWANIWLLIFWMNLRNLAMIWVAWSCVQVLWMREDISERCWKNLDWNVSWSANEVRIQFSWKRLWRCCLQILLMKRSLRGSLIDGFRKNLNSLKNNFLSWKIEANSSKYF